MTETPPEPVILGLSSKEKVCSTETVTPANT